MILCKEDITNIDTVTDYNINKTLTFLSYIKDKEKLNNKK
tara:strand:- start:537 stop:656 length:120 start_codon:yes stop_codon:yes gene_type:complete